MGSSTPSDTLASLHVEAANLRSLVLSVLDGRRLECLDDGDMALLRWLCYAQAEVALRIRSCHRLAAAPAPSRKVIPFQDQGFWPR
jgi:hypothetical protein